MNRAIPLLALHEIKGVSGAFLTLGVNTVLPVVATIFSNFRELASDVTTVLHDAPRFPPQRPLVSGQW